MSQYSKFLTHFLLGFFVFILGIFFLVTWMDPFRNLNFPWKTSFISDRNQSYKRFKLLEKAQGITDIIIGSSTSEAFVPQVLKEKFGVNAFAANAGGASLPLRYLMIQYALQTQPSLKRMIYVADLFEITRPKLESTVYYQSEMMQFIESDIASQTQPDFSQRFYDFFSFLIIDRSIRTLKDHLQDQKGKFKSAYLIDGSTTQSMIGGRGGDTIENRAITSAHGMKSLYGNLKDLHPNAVEIYQRLRRLLRLHSNIELHFVMAPFHERFYNEFKHQFERTHVYSKWRDFIHSLKSQNIYIHDFTYPMYLEQGITQEGRFWQDGTHFTSETMLKMAEQIYR